MNRELDENFEDVAESGGKLTQRTNSLVRRLTIRNNSHKPKSTVPDDMAPPVNKSKNVMPQKTYIFWILIFIIFFMAAVNLLLLVIMMNVLNIGEGMESMEMLTKEDIIKFFGEVDFDSVVYEKGRLESFQSIPMGISGNDAAIVMTVKDPDTMVATSKLRVDEDEILFSEVDKFDVIDPRSGKNIFSTNFKEFAIPRGVPRLDVKKLSVYRLISPLDSNMTIKPDTGMTRLRGNEGVSIGGKEILFRAEGDIFLNSVNDGGINFLSDKIKISDVPHSSGARSANPYQHTLKYKLCVCMPQGILFQVLVPKNVESYKACSYVDPDQSPCGNNDQSFFG